MEFRILVVDDEESLRDIFDQVLTEEGYRVTLARSGEEGLAAFKNEPFPLVITDIRLGGVSGIQLLKEIKLIHPETEVVVMTAHASLDTAISALRTGAYDYLIKPFENLQLISAVVHRSMEKIRLKNENQNLIEMLKHNNDELKRVNEYVRNAAIHDPLTRLYNRRYFNERLKEELTRAKREKTTMAVLMCDLDRFKAINDTQGHQIGDQVLEEVAQQIKRTSRKSDLVFRWGGDEFVVLLSNTTLQGSHVAAGAIRKSVQGIQIGIPCDLDVSIGIALFPQHTQDPTELLRLADRALYIAKRGGENIHVGEENFKLDNSTLRILFQPVKNLETDEVIGFEALSSDSRNQESIDEIFVKFKAIGQLFDLKVFCFNQQIEKAKEIGMKRIFINVDFETLNRMEPIPLGSGPEVILEISETESVYEVESHLAAVRKWREQGYQFAIDDFGAGFISLPFISRFVPEYIKMDRGTLLQAVSCLEFRSFMKKLIFALQQYTGKGFIAEGVETEKELAIVKEFGIPYAQGYLLGKPSDVPTPS